MHAGGLCGHISAVGKRPAEKFICEKLNVVNVKELEPRVFI
ncbi:MAG: hypothetical protein ACI9Y1_002178 [Lentisphaeria bacterium]|jgi:hypothetical protein